VYKGFKKIFHGKGVNMKTHW